MNLSDILGTPVSHDAVGQIGHIRNAVLDARTRQLEAWHLSADAPGEPSLGLFALSELEIGDGQAELKIGASELEERQAQANSETARSTRLAAAMPMMMTGPFGYTVAPALTEVELQALTAAQAPDLPEDSTKLYAADLLGQPVFDVSGECGTLGDLSFDVVSGALQAVAIRSGDDLTALPMSRVRRIVGDGGYVVLGEAAEKPDWMPDPCPQFQDDVPSSES